MTEERGLRGLRRTYLPNCGSRAQSPIFHSFFKLMIHWLQLFSVLELHEAFPAGHKCGGQPTSVGNWPAASLLTGMYTNSKVKLG